MKNTKRILALAAALLTAFGAVGCGANDNSTSSEDKKLKESQQEIVERLANDMTNTRELENSTIKWFSHWDINPTNSEDKEIGVDLALFQTKYNGKIEWISTTWETKFDDLAKLVIAQNSPDFCGADDMDIFPKGALQGMIEPIDDYFDFSDPLWADIKTATDQFILNGKHYVSVIRTEPSYVFIYNRNTIDAAGFDDPAELFAKGEWNWDTFSEMCRDFVNPDEEKYALDGWHYEKALMQSCGVPLIGIEDGKIVNNITNTEVAKAQNMMYDLQKNGVVFPKHNNGWQLRGNQEGGGMGSGLTLFYPIGLWAIEDAPSVTEQYGDIAEGEVMFVPVPSSADSDVTYVPSRIHGFCIVKGAQNPEGVAAFLDCCRASEIDEAAKGITYEQYQEDYGWTDEMIEMRATIYELSSQNPVFDFEQGVNSDLNNICDTAIRGTMNPQEQKTWTEVVGENQQAIDYLVNEANKNFVQ